MSHRPSDGGGKTKGSSRDPQDLQESPVNISKEFNHKTPLRESGKQGDYKSYSEFSYPLHGGSGHYSSYTAETGGSKTSCTKITEYTVSTSLGLKTSHHRGTATPFGRDKDQIAHDFDRLWAAPESYGDANVDIGSAHATHLQNLLPQQQDSPYTKASSSNPRPSQNYIDSRRPSDYSSGRTETSNTTAYPEPLSSHPRKDMLDASGTDRHHHHHKSPHSKRREQKSASSQSRTHNHNHNRQNQKRPNPPCPFPPDEQLPDHYATLAISSKASPAEIASAAKTQRIRVHPDRCKKAGMSATELENVDAEAARVGQAAEVLLDSEKKAQYDRDCHFAHMPQCVS